MLTANYKSLTANSNLSQQIQIAHSKFKSLTANSNRSQQIQIAHSELQITHSKLQIDHSKFQIAHSNSSRPQQIQIVLSKFKLKSLTGISRVYLFVEGRGYFFECRGYIVEGPCVTLKNVWKSVKRIYIKFAHRACVLYYSLCSYPCILSSRNAPRRRDYDCPCVDQFIEQANKFYPTIKFVAEISKNEITFLDPVVFKGERSIQKRFHFGHQNSLQT